MMKNKILLFAFLGLFLLAFAGAQSANVSVQKVCCEQTTNNLYCQYTTPDQCAAGSKQAPTSCDSTSFCKKGTCYSNKEGTCMDNTPQKVCNIGNSTWFAGRPAQCDLGCCTLGDQAAFVSLVRCKKLAGSLGIPLNYDKNVNTELSCIMSVRNQDKGACVYDFEFEKNCKFTTRSDCNSGTGNLTGKGTFYKDRLCTDESLGTICEKTTKTMCVSGKEEVYFKDTCGNPANVFDSSKKNDQTYWNKIVAPEQSCNTNSNNAGSGSCGNCNYLLGSICREKNEGSGNYQCEDLNCAQTSAGPKKHGESWCIYTDAGSTGTGKNSVGSRFYRHVCLNGKEYVEPCADFRQEECIQDKLVSDTGVTFTQAACRVNRWQDCTAQLNQIDCENQDRRDCIWNNKTGCLAKNSPGLQFWTGTDAQTQCAKATTICEKRFEKQGVFGSYKCVENCDCGSQTWIDQRMQVCNAIGDCGANVNWVNSAGLKKGFTLSSTTSKVD